MKILNRLAIIGALLISTVATSQATLNAVNANGKKDGLWKGTYEFSKRPRYEGTFINGKETGTFKFFDDTRAGSVIATREFNEQNNSAYTIFYDQSKNKVSEGVVLDKKFEGPWKYYHKASTVVMTLENYEKGQLTGTRTVYYPNGNIAEEVMYAKNKKNGSCKIYSENGIVLEETIYKNDEYNGLAIFRNAQGAMVSKGNFFNNKKVGVWEFFEKGKKINETNFDFPQNSSK